LPSIDEQFDDAVASLVPPGECATSTLPAEHCSSVVESARTRSPIFSIPAAAVLEGGERGRRRREKERSDSEIQNFRRRKKKLEHPFLRFSPSSPLFFLLDLTRPIPPSSLGLSPSLSKREQEKKSISAHVCSN